MGRNAKDMLNVDFWGLSIVEVPNAAELGLLFNTNSYKTLRIVTRMNLGYIRTGEREELSYTIQLKTRTN